MGVRRTVLAVDGGGSKTDVVLVDTTGVVLAHVRGPGSQPQHVGVAEAMRVLDALVGEVAALDGPESGEVADHAAVYLSGLDLEQEITAVRQEVGRRPWGVTTTVANDTFALLRAGSDSPDAVAVVCGTGINCVGRNASGRTSTFPALGMLTGDWGGGYHLGRLALWHAVRAEDGRGAATVLQTDITRHFGRETVQDVGVGMHLDEIDVRRLAELAPVVLSACTRGDAVATELVDRLADEVALMVSVTFRRLGLHGSPADVVLGGGVVRSRHPRLLDGVAERVHRSSPAARVLVVDDPPVLGAGLLGLDELGAGREAGKRLRDELGASPR